MKSMPLEALLKARERIRGGIVRAPFVESEALGELCGRRVFCKYENMQKTGSFKERGALNRLLQLSPEEKERGVVAASAGNHALGLAYHGRRLGVPVTIVMPVDTPLIKVIRTERLGARVVQAGARFEEAHAHAVSLVESEGLTLVHPFEDFDVIAGQGSVGLELAEEELPFDAVLAPVGGGGLIAGIATALKALKPHVKVIGVEAALVPGMAAALEGRALEKPDRTIADGIAIAQVGRLATDIVRERVDQWITVTEDEIAHGVQLFLELEKTLVEGAGAVGLAALLHRADAIPGKGVALVVSGGNMDITMLAKIIEKGLIAGGRLTRFSVRVPDSPGSLAAVTATISKRGGNIREVGHQRSFGDVPIGEVHVELTVETRSHRHIDDIAQGLREQGFRVELPD